MSTGSGNGGSNDGGSNGNGNKKKMTGDGEENSFNKCWGSFCKTLLCCCPVYSNWFINCYTEKKPTFLLYKKNFNFNI